MKSRGPVDKGDWIPLAKGKGESEEFLIKQCGCKPKYIEAKAGSGIFWLSTLAHQGHVPQGPRPEDKKQALAQARKVVYVCYANRRATAPTGTYSRSDEKYTPYTVKEADLLRSDIKKKLTWRKCVFLLNRATSHSALHGRMFPIYPGSRYKKMDRDEVKQMYQKVKQMYQKVVDTGLAAMPIEKKSSFKKMTKAMPVHLSTPEFSDLEIERICRLQGFEKALPRSTTAAPMDVAVAPVVAAVAAVADVAVAPDMADTENMVYTRDVM